VICAMQSMSAILAGIYTNELSKVQTLFSTYDIHTMEDNSLHETIVRSFGASLPLQSKLSYRLCYTHLLEEPEAGFMKPS